MRALRIETTPFAFTDILDVNIKKGVNTLGYAKIKGVISENLEDRYVQMSFSNTPVEIAAVDFSGNRQTIFKGVLENLNISSINGLKVMELSVMSYNKLLDITPGIRVFQNKDLTYNKMISAVLAPFNDSAAILHCGDGKAIGQMFVQYQETAWAFIMRMASMFEDVVVPDDTRKGIRLHFGFICKHASNPKPIDPISYDMRKDVISCLKKGSKSTVNNMGLNASFLTGNDARLGNYESEGNFVYFVVKDREIRELGESVIFKGQRLFVTKIESFIEGGELINLYTLMSRSGIWVEPYRNFTIIGASLSGQVSAVTGSHVKMSLPTAHSNKTDTSKWHPFSTVYSSPSGTGWYAMPEKGDSLRLYFPTEIEDDGYAISAVHTYGAPQTTGVAAKATGTSGSQSVGGSGSNGGSGGAEATADAAPEVPEPEKFNSEQFNSIMGSMANEDIKGRASKITEDATSQAAEIDPNNKFIQNDQGKFVMLTPNAIMMASEAGVILIEDGQGITICSNSDVYIEGGDITVASSGKISVIGDSEVSVEQGSAAATLSGGNVTFDAKKVKTV